MSEIRDLFRLLSGEWKGLVDAVAELKDHLEPKEFEEALAAAGIPAPKSAAGGSKAPVLAPPMPEEAPKPKAEKAPEPAGKAPAPPLPVVSAPPVEAVRPAVASRNGGASAAQAKVEDTKSVERILEESEGTVEPKQQTELNQKLGELLSLLKDNLASKAGGGSKASGEVVLPKHFTRDIAREVAGKVKESVLSSLRAAPAPSSAERVALQEEGAEKIPLDDVQGIIDRLTGKG